MKICIAGYGYVRENFFNTFRYFPNKESLIFFLPKKWLTKAGKVVFEPPKGVNIFNGRAYFYHSHYPLIGGLLKGLMPGLPLFLFKHRDAGVLYAPSEPILLTTLYNGFWAKLFGMKHVVFTWENIPYENKFKGLGLFSRKLLIKLNLWLADGVVCGNKKAEEIILKLGFKNTAVIPLSGVDTDFFRKEEITREFNGESFQDKMVFLFAGAIGIRKGIAHIANSFPKVVEEIPNAHLIIVGSGEWENELNKIILDLGLKKHVTRLPWAIHDELKKLMDISDIFLYPSFAFGGWEEQFGYSMAEASSMELPVISTRSGSIPDVVINNKTGILVSPNNQKELLRAMIRLAKDGTLRKTLGMAGREFVIKEFGNREVASKFYNFFNLICKIK